MKFTMLPLVVVLLGTPFANADVIPPKGFVALFNGKNIDGWHGRPHFSPTKLAAMTPDQRKAQLDKWMIETRQHWTVDNGELVNDGKGPYLTTDKEYGDIEFHIEFKTVAKADSGIYLRGTPQVQIWDYSLAGGKWNRGADQGSGGLFNNSKGSPSKEPRVLADKKFGEWNQFRIQQIGDRTSVWLNGHQVVDDSRMENFWDRRRPLFAKGVIQLQTHGGEIRWRNLFIREIGPEEAARILRKRDADGFDTVFNGKNFDGWQGDVDNYEVIDGAVRCRPDKGGNLFTKTEYSDFIARLEFQLPPGGNNGLAIRYPGTGQPHVSAVELQVLDSEHEKYSSLDARQYHGSAYGMAAAHRGYLRPTGEWNYQQVTVSGSTIRVELNGTEILNTDLAKITQHKDGKLPPGVKNTQGFFGFAGHNDPVAFRNISIKRLDGRHPTDTVTAINSWSPESWSQFRGPNGTARASSNKPLPVKIGPDQSVTWKVSLPPGHSSPIVHGQRIFLTAVRDKQLVTICLDRRTGKIVWEVEAPHQKLEDIHSIGSHAQCTPATDGERVVSIFGSCGVFCYDAATGSLLWKKLMGPFNNGFGAGNSPIIVGDRVVICQDHDTESFLMSVDKKTGKTIWRTDRSEFPRNYCSPVIWNVNGKQQIVIAATLRVVGYDLDTGKEIWTVRELSRAVCMTPVIGDNNVLYVAGWAAGGNETERIKVEPFDTVVAARDKNKNGTIEIEELPDGGPIHRRFTQVDRDKTGHITKAEFEYYRKLFDVARNVVIAIRPGAVGEATKTNVLWETRKFVPFCSSPVFYNNYIFMVKDGGILSSLNASTGAVLQTKRAAGTGNYYASPVAGNGNVYFVDQKGELTVISGYAHWRQLHKADFGEEVYATPAILDGQIFLRTAGHLYCFR